MISRILVVALVVSMIGCGGSIGRRATLTVKGKVTLDGKPIEGGTISFEPKDGKGGSVSASIMDGNYETRVEPGVKVVRISYPKLVRTEPAYPGSKDSPMISITTEVIPEKYNSASRLEKDLTEVSGSTDFTLTSTQ